MLKSSENKKSVRRTQ